MIKRLVDGSKYYANIGLNILLTVAIFAAHCSTLIIYLALVCYQKLV